MLHFPNQFVKHSTWHVGFFKAPQDLKPEGLLVFIIRNLGSSDNLPVVERRVLLKDSYGQQGELLQVQSGCLSAERKKKDLESNFRTQNCPIVVSVEAFSSQGSVEGKVDVYTRSGACAEHFSTCFHRVV